MGIFHMESSSSIQNLKAFNIFPMLGSQCQCTVDTWRAQETFNISNASLLVSVYCRHVESLGSFQYFQCQATSVSVVITNTNKEKVRTQITYITKFSKKRREGDKQRRRRKKRKKKKKQLLYGTTPTSSSFSSFSPFLCVCVFFFFSPTAVRMGPCFFFQEPEQFLRLKELRFEVFSVGPYYPIWVLTII